MLKFSVHTEGLESIKDRLMQASSEAEHILAVQIRKDTSPYVPALTGSLDTRTRIEGFSDAGLGPGTGGSMIVYPGPYALPLLREIDGGPDHRKQLRPEGRYKGCHGQKPCVQQVYARAGPIPLVRGQQSAEP